MPVRGFRRSIFEIRPDKSAKYTVVLLDSQVHFLDRVAIEARVRHGAIMLRSEIVYVLIEAAMRSGIDLSEAASQSEITTLMTRRWSRIFRRK